MKVLTVALAICMLSVIGCSDEETAPEYRWSAPVKTATVVPIQVPTGLNTVTPEPSKTESIELKTYTVVTGDSLSVIAQKYDTSVEAIQAVNDLSSTVILVDQKGRFRGRYKSKYDLDKLKTDIRWLLDSGS